MTAAQVCQRYDISLSSFRLHARVGGWRRMDQPASEIPPEPGEYHPDDNVSFADLADQAFLNIRRAVGAGRAAEASTWMRVYDKLADRARSQVMADLPDRALPVTLRDPLRLAAAQEETCNDSDAFSEPAGAASQDLDPLHPPFSESNPAPSDP
ncbi:hypothetical protein [Brevundimonas sp. Leaf363]|uniref:hypothetical protein n=1 Tax=Brevundimonas sp. Leaf363 TaxID=1736353 RepID=UPI0012E1B205|nr:hypothetical protein [Brevundimonas sp. Leaf363]